MVHHFILHYLSLPFGLFKQGKKGTKEDDDILEQLMLITSHKTVTCTCDIVSITLCFSVSTSWI